MTTRTRLPGNRFTQHMEAMRKRVAGLTHDLGHPLEPPEHTETLRELQLALDDLQVAEEEFRQQNEELAGTRLAIEAERQRYQELFEFAPDGYLVTDLHGVIREANRAAGELLHCSPAFLPGKPLALFVADDQRQAFRSQLNQLPLAGQRQEWEVRLQPRGAEPVAIVLAVAPVRNEGMSIRLGWLLRQPNSLVLGEETRTLRRQLQVLEVANQRKDAFLTQLSHEMRGPLAPLVNALHVMGLQGQDPSVVEQSRALAERQVHQLTRLVEDLLDLSRIGQGKLPLHKEPVAVDRALANAIETTRPLIESRAHQVTVRVPPEPFRLEADPARLEQVLVNLLINAAKYTPPGGHIALSAERDGSQMVLRIKDTGIGVSADMLPRIFDLFVQTEQAREHSQGGLGIGLALVRGLVEIHGGTVTAASPGPGQGSEFVVRLPALQQEQGEAAPADNPQADPAGKSLRILVVDDDVDGAESLALLLRLWRHEVATAHDGPSALEVARRHLPEVVLLDIGMPGGLSGYEVAQELRRLEGLDKVLLVALTGYSQPEAIQRSRQAGFHHHFVKPVAPEALQEFLACAGC